MSAAALRHAAKRLGGGVLQRSKSAAIVSSEEGRRLPTRLLHTTVDDTNIMVSRFAHIQDKKEELYNLVANFERTYRAPLKISWQNGWLLHRLSTQIEPRPSDPYWRMLRSVQRRTSFYTVVGLCTSGLAGAYATAYGMLWSKKHYGKDVEDWLNKQFK